jgi:primosomal protein N' (replication factor Y)
VQRQIVEEIGKESQKEQPKPCLIRGVTGSGKTAVYVELIARAVEQGKQAIVLIPEIALTYQTVMRFYQRFGERVSILNSQMSPGERYDQFLRAKNGELDVMIGPRSALFTPFSNLGYIIIDEEHETSYKSETTPRYHARETAIRRAQMANAVVVLGSATPSLESYYQAQNGTYRLFEMTKRVEEKPLPVSEIIDLREELKQGNRSILSVRLQELMEERLKWGQQTMLFLNRRGISSFVSCRACGHVFQCPHCDVSLSKHNNGKLVCHYCGYQQPEISKCPSCGSGYVGAFKAGTQKIEQVVKERFPDARVLRMDFDTTRNKDSYEKILSAFSNGEADILIGTQMIVKGHDFPNVTLVGILAADLSLHSSDFHGAERTFQLLTQAAGRAGRGSLPGNVVIQTYSPDNYSIQLAAVQDYVEFFHQEMQYRQLMGYPPARHMLQMLVASTDQEYAARCAQLLGQKVEKAQETGKITGMTMIGPADAAVARVKDVYKKVLYFKHPQYQMLVRVKDALELFIQKHREFQAVTIQFDFDPMSGF